LIDQRHDIAQHGAKRWRGPDAPAAVDLTEFS
jgi:hypothetical protein